MANVTGYVSFGATASTVAGTTTVACKEIKLLKNDGSYDIVFNIDNLTTEDGAFTLKAGESIENFPVDVKVLHYKTGSNTAAFRFIGLRERSVRY